MKTEYVRFEWTVSLIIEKLIIPLYLCLRVFLPYISYYSSVYYRMTVSHGQRDTEVKWMDAGSYLSLLNKSGIKTASKASPFCLFLPLPFYISTLIYCNYYLYKHPYLLLSICLDEISY